MNTLNHALWGATFGRIVDLPLEGALMGAMPDLLSIPFLTPYYFRGKRSPDKIPKWVVNWYAITHNWIVSGLIILCLFLISPKLSVIGFAYFWHAAEDAFVHEDFATMFLYPLWHGKIKGYSAHKHRWIQLVDLAVIVFLNFIFFK